MFAEDSVPAWSSVASYGAIVLLVVIGAVLGVRAAQTAKTPTP